MRWFCGGSEPPHLFILPAQYLAAVAAVVAAVVVVVARKPLKTLVRRLCAVLPLPPLKRGSRGIPWGMGYPPGPKQAETRMLEGTEFGDV